jgi:osmotically-inducible protein OsmY
MEDNNVNQGTSNQSNQDWNRNKLRSEQEQWLEEDRKYNEQQNRGMNRQYRDIGYSGDSSRGMGEEDDYNRRSYMNENEDYRPQYNRNYENTQYGRSGEYGYRNQNTNYNDQNSQHDDWKRGERMNRGNMQNINYGDMYHGNVERREEETNRAQSDLQRRNESRRQGGEQYGINYNRQHYDMGGGYGSSGNMNNGRQDWDSQNRGAGSNDYGRNEYNISNDRGRRVYNDEYGNYGSSGGYANMSDDNREWDRQRRTKDWWDRTKGKISSRFDRDDNEHRNDTDYSGGHRGKGPSDYRRSQDRIREDVCDRLTDDDRIDARNVHIHIDNDDVVILSGTVNSKEEKRRAEDVVESISGVKNVENRLHVGRPTDMAAHDYTGSTDMPGGIGRESGTTNEIIQNMKNDREAEKKM